MTDVQSQMEANGLPSKFESRSDQTTEAHMATNMTAAAANSEATTTFDMKQAASVPLESSTLVEPVTSINTLLVPESQPTPETDSAPLTNGNTTEAGAGVQVNGHGASSLLEPAVDVSMTESVVPSSMPSEIPSSNTTADLHQPHTALASDTQLITETAALVRQPISDLRMEPHSDALAPETVAVIEERKHEEDNNADLPVAPPAPESSSFPLPAVSLAAQSTTNGLPSPPPAPEMSHATLPSELSVPVSETIPAPVVEEGPVAPVPTPAIPATQTEDTEMADVPVSANNVKAARGRDEDEMELEEPSAKRIKKDESPAIQASEFKMPDAPSTISVASPQPTNGLKIEGDDAVTTPRLTHMKKIISNLKKSSASTAFRIPVDYVSLNIPNYPDIVKQPMDLSTVDAKLKNDQYSGVREFITDFELIVNNCTLFNGKDHGITQQALKMQSSFNNQMAHLPPATLVEPSKAEKKAMKLKTEPVRAIPPRRPSVTIPGSVRSPKAAAASTTPSFAPHPDGIPLIRRDSSIVDGRPKRAIVPPKRNSDFAGVRPKKKKYELQLRFCQEALKELTNPKHWALNQYFTHPVDPVALNIPTYFHIIKKPMDLSTVQTKLENNQYEKAKDFEEDVRLIFKNCYKFNPKEDFVNQTGHQFEELFNRKWATKDDWIAAREPQSEPPSDAEEDEDEEEASEEVDQDSEDDRNDKIKQLQAQIEAMSKQMGELTQPKKKKKSSPPAPKKSKSKTKKDKPASTFPNLAKSQEKKKKLGTKPKAEKDRYVTFAEKQYISNGIGMLPERQMQEALRIIQQSVPSLANSDGEIELDIEEVPNHALLKLLTFVKKYAGPPPDEPEVKTENFAASTAPTKSRKNKPMSKLEQEAQIEELKGKLGAYGGPVSPDAVSGEGNESSDDSADSEESEEE